MVCKECGTRVDNTDKYCPKCGEKLQYAQKREPVRQDNAGSAASDIRARIAETLRKKKEKVVTDLNRHTEYSYREAMKYFVNHKSDDPNIAKGAMVLEQLQSGYQIYQVFLDRNNELVEDKHGCPLGFKLKINGMDDELSELFNTNNVVLVE
jgi:predicted  nucleic acid-binding Zn-ribbon protein